MCICFVNSVTREHIDVRALNIWSPSCYLSSISTRKSWEAKVAGTLPKKGSQNMLSHIFPKAKCAFWHLKFSLVSYLPAIWLGLKEEFFVLCVSWLISFARTQEFSHKHIYKGSRRCCLVFFWRQIRKNVPRCSFHLYHFSSFAEILPSSPNTYKNGVKAAYFYLHGRSLTNISLHWNKPSRMFERLLCI